MHSTKPTWILMTTVKVPRMNPHYMYLTSFYFMEIFHSFWTLILFNAHYLGDNEVTDLFQPLDFLAWTNFVAKMSLNISPVSQS